MDEYEDLDAYNGDTEHDMWVDFGHYVIGLPLCSCKTKPASPMFSVKTTSMNLLTTLTTGTNYV